MTRKDYELLARTIGAAEARGKRGTNGPARVAASGMAGVIVALLCDALAAENPRFDRARFLAACVAAADSAEA